MSNLKEVINELNIIVQSNPLYNSFSEGNIWEIDGKVDIEYPMVWVDAEQNPHNILLGSVEYIVDIYFIDLVYNDSSNELNIKSDTMETAIDLVRFLKEQTELSFYVKDNQYVAQVFTEKFNDTVSGTKLTLTLTVKGSGSKCKNVFTYNG